MNLSLIECVAIGVAVVLVSALFGKVIRWGDGREGPPQPDAPPEEILDLAHPWMQGKLQQLLDYRGIHGSCDIRDGKVKPVLTKETGAILAAEIRTAVDQAMARTGQNSNLALYTHRNGIFVPLGQLTLEDVVTLSRLLEAQE